LEGYELPTFPAIYLEALQQVRDVESSTGALADVLATDPGLTARLLRTVNSAAFGLRSQVTSVHHAVSLLGRGHVESMLVSLASHSTLPSERCDGFEPERFWQTAARRAAVARALADHVSPSERSECFTAALLSDMAIPMLCTRKGEPYARIVGEWHDGHGELQEMEAEAFGWDHAQVAAMMCSTWEFPDVIAEAIAAHHGGADPETRGLPAVNLAVQIPEVSPEAHLDRLARQAHELTGLDPSDVQTLLDESFRNAEEIAEQFTT
jgi:HD-like signal output (HDOD) protein